MLHDQFEITPMPAWNQQERPVAYLSRPAMLFVSDAIEVALDGIDTVSADREQWADEVVILSGMLRDLLDEEVES